MTTVLEKEKRKRSVDETTSAEKKVATGSADGKSRNGKVMIILRGPSGCGKTTFATQLLGLDNSHLHLEYVNSVRKFHVCSTDDYFLQSIPLDLDDSETQNDASEAKTLEPHNEDNEDKNKKQGSEVQCRKITSRRDLSFFTTPSNRPTKEIYVFDPKMIGPYHHQNQIRVRNQMMLGVSPLIIDNTNITASAIKPYVLLADEFEYEVVIINPQDFSNEQDNPIIIPNTTKINRELIFERASVRTSNGSGKTIPTEILEKMIDDFENKALLTVEEIRMAENFAAKK